MRWIRHLINEQTELIDNQISLSIPGSGRQIEWVSPLAKHNHEEYRDTAFLKALGLSEYSSTLADFWPAKGPQWDALGKIPDQTILLVEAKANIPEILSTCKARSPKSLDQISKSVKATQQYLNVQWSACWLENFYQYANRISHLYFFREICGINAQLIFIYFCNDISYKTTSYEQWQGALLLQKSMMSLKRHRLQKYVHEFFFEVSASFDLAAHTESHL